METVGCVDTNYVYSVKLFQISWNNSRSKLLESVITQFQCWILSPTFHPSHRRPRKAWNSLNVSFDWKSNARAIWTRGGFVARTLSNFLHLSTAVNELSFPLFARAFRSRIFSSPNFRSKDFRFFPLFSHLAHLVYLTTYLFFFFAPFNLAVQDLRRAKLWINNFLHHEDYYS